MEIDYNPSKWTPCPPDCAYCTDPFFGHPFPHETQTRISDGKRPFQVRKEQSELDEKLEGAQ